MQDVKADEAEHDWEGEAVTTIRRMRQSLQKCSQKINQIESDLDALENDSFTEDDDCDQYEDSALRFRLSKTLRKEQ